MKMTRRTLAGVIAAPAIFRGPIVKAQTPVTSGAERNGARAGFQDAARQLAAVKLPRSVEPASRFEA
jgi:hypothetical protein